MNEATDQRTPGKSRRVSSSDTVTESIVDQSEQSPPEVPKAKAAAVVLVTNKRNRLIELDFGRGREIRILPFGEQEMLEAYLDHPEFKREQANLIVSKVR